MKKQTFVALILTISSGVAGTAAISQIPKHVVLPEYLNNVIFFVLMGFLGMGVAFGIAISDKIPEEIKL